VTTCIEILQDFYSNFQIYYFHSNNLQKSFLLLFVETKRKKQPSLLRKETLRIQNTMFISVLSSLFDLFTRPLYSFNFFSLSHVCPCSVYTFRLPNARRPTYPFVLLKQEYSVFGILVRVYYSDSVYRALARLISKENSSTREF
jgi:hypothetical protein